LDRLTREHTQSATMAGRQTYRSGQRQLIGVVMTGRNAIGVLPTGGGKLFCFQLPSLFLPQAILVVLAAHLLACRIRRILEDTEGPPYTHCRPYQHLDPGRDEQHRLQDIRSRTAEIIYVTPER
jgi:ATP-dependent DNA helicase RecQ